MTIRIGTRGSRLALTQTGTMAAALEAAGVETDTVVIQTAGDADRTSSFAAIGAAGIFVRELQRALLDGEVDVAVHSFKDLPSDSPAGLVIAAVPRRADVRDRLFVRVEAHDPAQPALPLRAGARVGTSAARRTALVRELRRDLVTRPLRGNVPTRLERLVGGDYDAIVLAGAGVDRLAAGGYVLPEGLVTLDLDPRTFVPAPSQGALALEVRAEDLATRRVIGTLQHGPSARAVAVERALLDRLSAGCEVAFGAWCEDAGVEGFTLHGLLERDGLVRRAVATGHETDALVGAVHQGLIGPAQAGTP